MSIAKKICSVEGCENPVKAIKLCSKHCGRLYRYGRLTLKPPTIKILKICNIDGCDRYVKAKEMCSLHYDRAWRPKTLRMHGLNGIPEQGTWEAIKQRCFNKNNLKYNYYGDRGITMCRGWANSFKAFYEDVGKRPEPLYTLDRIDNDGNYSCGKCEECLEKGWPMNCRWVTRKVQMLNQRLIRKSNTSGYRGVTWDKRRSKWSARIMNDYRSFDLGYYDDITKAARAYDRRAVQLWGEYAKTNFPLSDYQPGGPYAT